ncbi:MAG TPA: DNA polymerase III subunit [Steroidobacteraceae bacterium]|nr:DNA polymerase III subunit [Gammaproteobacteria bacterium]HEV2284661.1 DNA polymerase III subunit [Steroidobacteraceae bacterium]
MSGTPMPEWIAPQAAALTGAARAGRLPHALLVHEAPGAGGDWLAHYAARLALCQHPAEAPCGSCTGCRRALAWQHPDLARVAPLEDSRQIRIEQLRELSAELALTSHAGGYKVGIVTPADAMNRFAANALLKTLEEPPARTLLVLVATQPSRLPPTVLSRCQRLTVRAPTRAQAVAWLTEVRGAGEWEAALAVIGEAPMLLFEADPKPIAQAGAESRETLAAIAAGRADPVAAAERWARNEPALRLRCFENWLTERIRRSPGTGNLMPEVGAGPYLPGPGAFLNIRELFGLLDEVRELRTALDVPLNRALALEALLRRLAPRGAGVAA